MTPRSQGLAPGPPDFLGAHAYGPEATAHSPMPCCADHPGAECIPWPTGEVAAYELFVEGDELYDAMAASIATAQQQIDLETYIYAADEVGWHLGEALAERARAGVRVRMLVDAAGSHFSLSRDLVGFLRRHGVAALALIQARLTATSATLVAAPPNLHVIRDELPGIDLQRRPGG